jgi:hypothetical protein
MSELKQDYSTGDELTASQLNTDNGIASLAGALKDDLNAGEAINGATLPVAVYQDPSDNELYACDGNDTTKLLFIGFATSNSTDGNPIDFQGHGIVAGFSGLTEGVKYYVQDDKTIGVSMGTYGILVGIAISETELLILKENIFIKETVASDVLRQSADTERTEPTATYDLQKSIRIKLQGTVRVSFDLRDSVSVGSYPSYGRIYVNGGAVGTERTVASTNYSTFSEDITTVNDGDYYAIQLYSKGNGASGSTAYVRNFRVYYDKVLVPDTTVITN